MFRRDQLLQPTDKSAQSGTEKTAAGDKRKGRTMVTVGGTKMLLTPVEAAEQLAVSRTKVYELMAAGVLRSIHIGRLRRVPVDALRDFIGDMESR